MRHRVELLDLQVMLVMTVRRHASEQLIGLDLRANKFALSSRDKLRRSLLRLEHHQVLSHDRQARCWVLVDYTVAMQWCATTREALEEQGAMLKQTEALLGQMENTMDRLEDQVAGHGAWHRRWVKKAKE